MPFCQTCGELVPDDVHYCPNCGTPMELQEAESAAVPDTAEIPEETTLFEENEMPAWNQPDSAEAPSEPENTANENPYVNNSSASEIPSYSAPQSNPYSPEANIPNTQQPYADYQNAYGQNPNNAPYSAPNPMYGQPMPPMPGQQMGTPYPMMQPKKTDGKSVASMILGIISIVFSCSYGFGLIPGIVGLILAIISRKEEAKRNETNNNGTTMAGLICSIIGIAISVIVIVLVVLLVIGIVSTTDTYDYYDYSSAAFLFWN